MKKVMMVGRSGAGKTTLCQYLKGDDLKYKKTQAIEVIDGTMIDTPGEYLERRDMYRALIVTSVEADVILMIFGATDGDSMFAPMFSSMFSKPTVGIITKCDIADDNQIKRARQALELAGATKIFEISSVTGDGVDALIDYLNEN